MGMCNMVAGCCSHFVLALDERGWPAQYPAQYPGATNVHEDGVPADVCGVADDWCTGP